MAFSYQLHSKVQATELPAAARQRQAENSPLRAATTTTELLLVAVLMLSACGR
jgi:hypothetical protein